MKILINGEINNSISAQDRGMHYGDGIFETMLCTNGNIPFLAEHIKRLKKGCRILFMPEPDEKTLMLEINSLIKENENCIVKIILTRGSSGRGYKIPEMQSPTRIISIHPISDNITKIQKEGVSLVHCRRKLACPEGFSEIKHTNRLEYVLARSEWNDPVIYDGILCNRNGNIIETTSSNIFWLKDGILYTPDLSECGLKGIMRDFVLNKIRTENLIAENKIRIREEDFFPDAPADAEEVFITNSIIGIVPVMSIDNIRYRGKNNFVRLLQKSHDEFRKGHAMN